ncbi:uncharacterized protein LOC142236529 isoform X4 [Haematobia irritans]|uniref:uncharacterized protein LOC142236529 isoform X4 n=1 Tax=Haematobia irritans TaxID=7368 RepID=UPI003F508F56
MSTRRSASVGALPLEKKHFVSRNESTGGVTLDVRCACQFYQSDSLLPERINPVDSRPGSKLGFHHDPQCNTGGEISYEDILRDPTAAVPLAAAPFATATQGFRPMAMAMPSASGDRRLLAGERVTLPDPERQSMRSVGKHRSWDQASGSVDISFVEKYPELEETAKTRGLVVRSISDDDPHQIPGGMHRSRQRYTSVDRMSNISGGQRDPETLSMHSVRSLRRISRSPSKGDLFVADINIEQHPPPLRSGHRSVSASRRPSRIDLAAPHINVITPTPLPQLSQQPPNFQRQITPRRSISQPPIEQQGEIDYRYAKPPMTADYMRPEETNKENNASHQNLIPGQVLPQNRPIDMTRYQSSDENSTLVDQSKVGYVQPPATVSMAPLQPMSTSKPYDALEETVAELEAIATTRNVEDVVDNIKIERLSPPLVEDIPSPCLNLDEETIIEINREVNMVDIDKLVKEEEEKARERAKSPTRLMQRFSPAKELKSNAMDRLSPTRQRQQLSPTRQLDTLQVPQETSHQLKRGHSPERQPSPTRTKKMLAESESGAPDENGAVKPTYSARFKSLFTSKPKDDANGLAEPTSMQRERSPSPAPSILKMPSFLSKDKNGTQREKSPSPAPSAFKMPSLFSKDRNGKQHEKSPSPAPQKNKLMSMFSSKEMPAASTITSGSSSAVHTNKPKAEPMSIQVHETFSLKVDEMDQYLSRPTKSAAPPPSHAASGSMPMLNKSPSIPISMSSRDDFLESEHVSMSIDEAFAPVVIGRSASTQFSMDQVTLPSQTSSQDRGLRMRSLSKEASSHQQSSSEMQSNSWSREPSIHHHPELQGKPLFSAPIMMDNSGSLPQSVSPDRRTHMHGQRSPSEQRYMQLNAKQSFLDGRTQSQDRQGLGGSHDNLSGSRMTKTVSFHFDERKSRLSEFQNRSAPQQEPSKKEFLERTYFSSRDHEYEPIGIPSTEEQKSSDIKEQHPTTNESQSAVTASEEQTKTAEDFQREIEEHFFKPKTPGAPTPQTELTVEPDSPTEEAVDESAETTKGGMKSFMASAQDRTRKMQMGLKSQAGKLRTKFKASPKKSPSSSPKAKERRKFKAPEFSKMKMPDIKRPDMSKLKDFKRPEFTKFSKPDMSKFKLPEMPAIKLGRSKSFKESEPTDEDMSVEVSEKKVPADSTSPQKKLFDFGNLNFGTYPRVLRKKKKPLEVESSFDTGTATEATSVIPSTTTQPSVESSSSPQGDRGPGPVRSRWADKFSDVSYNDSEGSRYRRYGSEQESFDRESSLERRMREDLEDTVSEEPSNMGILGGVTDNKEFAEFDEENRAIHEISNLRSGEFRRRPMVHQDSDLRSEDDAVGWTEREIQKNILLRKGELEAEASYQRYHHDNQSTASSGKKVVLEEIGEDEFFLRKRGISQDNIEINQYIRSAIRGEDYDKPINTLQHVGQTRDYGDYDVPPPKPKRLHKHYQPTNDSQEFESYGDEFSISQNGSAYFDAPRRPMRKGRSRSKYSMESQDVRYLDDEFSHEPSHEAASGVWNDLNMSEKENIPVRHEHRLDADEGDDISRPQPPRRHKRRRDTSMDKDSYINGFGGRSVSNSFLQPTEDVIVYRTEHEYHHVPIATPDKYSDSLSAHNSSKHYDMDNGNHHEHHTSQGAISMEQNDEQQGDDETDKYVIEMLENDGYAIVRKDHQIPKPTPPARRKKFTHLPGDRFATMPNMRTKRSTPPPERPPPPRGYTPVSDIVMPSMRKSAISLDARPNYQDEGDYEEPGFNMRPESPRSNLQSGDVINKMKYRPLPPPPRPPREKRNRSASKGSEAQLRGTDEVDVVDGLLESDSHFEEVEASTQTDPLPDDFVCEEFEITDDMKVIEPRIIPKTIEEMLQEELEKELQTINHQVIDSEQLSKGLQRFRESNQRSLSERSRASSQADRSKSQSRPQTPSAIMVERQSSTPILKDNTESMVEASLLVRPIDDLELEEEELRREGLLTDESQHSQISDHRADIHVPVSEASYAPSSTDIDGALPSDQETQQTDEEVERTLQRYRDELDEIGRQLMETQLTSQEGSPSVSREDMLKDSDREEHSEKWETSDREDQPKEPWQLSDIEEMRSDMEEVTSEREDLKSDMEELTSEREELKSDMEELKSDREDHKSDMEEINSQRGDEEPTKETHTAATGEPEEGEEEEEAPFEKEFTPLPKEYRVDTPTTSAPLPPPRRKSTTAIDHRFEDEEEVTEPPVETKEVVVMQTIAKSETPANTQIPARLSELEVERLRVHALQAGQIMVSQLHGQQISSEELECKSGNLVVKNIELPPGLIEDIVERVRQTERTHHLTAETQTSVQSSSVENSPVRDVIPPPKPPRLRDLESAVKKQSETITPVHNTDEQTQTDAAAPTETASTTNVLPGNLPSTVFPTAEYLQSLAPLAFYNLHRAQQEMSDQAPRQRRHRRSVSPSGDEPKTEESSDDGPRRRRTRSTRTPSTEDPQSITKAGRKFITACSLSLAKIINQLTDYVTGKEPKEGVEDPNAISSRHVPALAVLFLVITFCVLIFLLTGRNVHTHHWDYFNPPGQDGRPS